MTTAPLDRDTTRSTAERVGALLLAFEHPGLDASEQTVSDLARRVGRERSQVSRMLHSLAKTGLVEQNPNTKAYRLGWNLRVLASVAGDYPLVQAGRPVLQALVAKTGEVALLSIQEGNRSLTVLREESQQSLRAGGWVGRRSPLHCTASGRALLFDTDDEQVAALTEPDLETAVSGDRAPRTVDELISRLVYERARGFAVASEEVEVGLTSISTPVRDVAGHIIGVVNVSAPTSRIVDRVDSIGYLLTTGARRITQSLRTRAGSAPRD